MMTVMELRAFYDRLCFALTAYETDSTDDEHDKGLALYTDIVSIVNDMEEKMF